MRLTNTKIWLRGLTISVAACSAAIATAQTEVRFSVVPAGASLSSGGSFSLVGSAGQSDAGVAEGGSFSLSGGFLPIVGNDNPPPPPPEHVYGDLDCDGLVTNFDVDPFLIALSDPEAYAIAYPGCDRMNADANHDGNVDNFDVDAFVDCLNYGGCQ